MSSVRVSDQFYTGSRLLLPISETVGLPIDQLNFIVCEFFALALGHPFRVFLGPHVVTPLVRHTFELCTGMGIMLFLFGNHMWFVLAQTLSCYILIRVLPEKWMPHIVTSVAIMQLSVCHIWRQMFYQNVLSSINLSGTLMINTQRMTALAWSVFDGRIKHVNKLSAHQQHQAVSKMPRLLEVLSYSFSFHGVIYGPFCFYRDYINFIEGANLHGHVAAKNANGHCDPSIECPSPMNRVMGKMVIFILCSAVCLFMVPKFPLVQLSDPAFLSFGFLRTWEYIIVFTSLSRFKFYTAWTLAEAVNNNAGLGFYYDDKGEPKWDLVDCVHIWHLEGGATSLKVIVDNWNISTTRWLRYIVYERTSSLRTLKVLSMSIIWHGFYPGYFLTAASTGIFVIASRKVRRNFRPWFVMNKQRHLVYDLITLLVTRLVISYLIFPFLHLELAVSLEIYKKLYFCLHILAIAVITFLPTPAKKHEIVKKVD